VDLLYGIRGRARRESGQQAGGANQPAPKKVGAARVTEDGYPCHPERMVVYEARLLLGASSSASPGGGGRNPTARGVFLVYPQNDFLRDVRLFIRIQHT